jgi:hypothetical protein
VIPSSRSAAALAVLAALLATARPAAAALPDYQGFQLQARSNFSGAFNLPDGAFFSNTTPRINQARQVCFDLAVISGTSSQGLWFGGGGSGEIVYQSEADAFIFDTGINDAGLVVLDLAFSSQDGLWIYDPGTGMTSFATNLPLGADGWGSPGINAAGELGYRAGFSGGHAYASWTGAGSPAIHATEASIDVGSPYSFLFTPSFNGAREIAGKVRLGGAGQVGNERPDQIRVFDSAGASVLIAEDRDSNPASPYLGFDNSVSLTDSGWVAFTASLDGGARGVFFSDGTTTRSIATTALPEVSEIEFFAPAANEAGVVAFRAKDGSGLRAVWVGDGTDLEVVVREHDLIETDLGTARIDQNDSSPVFGGGPSINPRGDVAFAATLTPPGNDQIEWGTGVFVALAPTAIFTDGFESGDTSAWSATLP